MLPPRIPKKAKRASRWRSQAHCSFVRSHACCVAACSGRPIEVAHVRVGSGAGVGQRPHDYFTVSLCRDHHSEQHRIGERSFEARYAIELSSLAAEFAKHSPKAREIAEARNAG